MYLNKLLIKDFGKFNNAELELKTGINVVHGGKGSGKSTVKDFVVAMLYGVDNARGIDNSADINEARKPKGRKGFSGKAYIQSNNNKYFIERSFYKRNKSVNVLDIQSGRNVKLEAKGSLHGTLLQLDKSTYADALCIEPPKAQDRVALAQEMNDNIDALVNTGSTKLNKARMLEQLREERAKYDLKPILDKMEGVSEKLEAYVDAPAELKQVKKQIKQLDEEFATEVAKRKREARKLIDTDDGSVIYHNDARLSHKLDSIAKGAGDNDEADEQLQPQKKLTDKLWVILLTGLLVIAAITLMVNILGFDKNVKQLFVVCTILFVIVTIVEDMYLKGFFDDDISTPSEEEFHKIIAELEEQAAASEEVEYDDVDISFANEYAEKKAALKEREKQLAEDVIKKRELDEELSSLESMRDGCEDERKAITLAMETINAISEDLREELGGMINGNTADIVNRITGGSCTDVRYDRNVKLTACVSDEYVELARLDERLLRDVWLSVNIAVARFFCRNKMTVILDDVIKTTDSTKLFNIVECLNTIPTEQIIMLTSDDSMADKLTAINIGYNKIELG